MVLSLVLLCAYISLRRSLLVLSLDGQHVRHGSGASRAAQRVGKRKKQKRRKPE